VRVTRIAAGFLDPLQPLPALPPPSSASRGNFGIGSKPTVAFRNHVRQVGDIVRSLSVDQGDGDGFSGRTTVCPDTNIFPIAKNSYAARDHGSRQNQPTPDGPGQTSMTAVRHCLILSYAHRARRNDVYARFQSASTRLFLTHREYPFVGDTNDFTPELTKC